MEEVRQGGTVLTVCTARLWMSAKPILCSALPVCMWHQSRHMHSAA